MNTGNIAVWAKKNQLIIIASIFFIFWKLFLVGILWDERSIAPEPDDSYEYIARIAAVSECQNGLFCPFTGVSMYDHSGFAYLSYGLLFGLAGKTLNLPPEATFYYGFYFGTILLALILPLFISAFTQNRFIIALSILFLAFYHGTGESHGFFWVVPSFFSITIFFLLYRFITSKQQEPSLYIATAILSTIYAFTHPISIYLVFFFPLYLFIYFYLTRKYSLLEIQKVTFVLLITLGSAVMQSQYLAHASQLNYYGLGNSLFQAHQVMDNLIHENRSEHHFDYNVVNVEKKDFLTTRITTLNATYFRYILPHWLMIFPFILALWILYYRQEFRLLAFYFSAFLFFIGTTLFHEFGFRSAILLWPATYLIAAFSFGHAYLLLKERLSGTALSLGKAFIILSALVFLFLNGIFSVGYNMNVNQRKNFEIDESFATYILSRMETNDRIALNSILARTGAGSKLFINGKTSPISSHPRFIARIDPSVEIITNERPSFVQRISFEVAHSLGILPRTSASTRHDMLPPIEGYHLDSRFGDISIFESN